MAQDPAFLFYSSDFLTGVADLTMQERGYYITLLCLQHQKGHLTEKTICLSLGLASVNEIPDLLKKFKTDSEGKYFNNRLETEIEKRQKYAESRRANGSKGGRPTKKDNPQENHMESMCETICEAYENHTENENVIEDIVINKGMGVDEFFETIWRLYPNKKGKAQVSASTKKKLLAVGYDVLAKCLERYKSDKPDWQEYQYGSTFFNGGYVDYLDENYQQAQQEQEAQNTGIGGRVYQ